MITNLRAQNFKSWKDTGDLRLAPLTGFFGTNSSGKSSILQVLLMMKQTAESSDPNRVLHLGGDPQSYVDLGTFADVIHGHNLHNSLTLSIRYPFGQGSLRFDVSLREDNGRIVESDKKYFFRNRDNIFEDVGAETGPGLAWEWARTIRNVVYIGPLRVPPQRWYLSGSTPPRDVGKDGADTIQALLAASSSVSRNVADWLVRMRLVHSFVLRPIAPNRRDHEVLIKTTEESPEVLLTDVGFGISQLLPVLVLCYYVPEGTTLLLEQPELHLHPSAQSVLADVFIDVVKNRKLQIIFESHSEHLLRRIQRRIAEGELPAQDASMYFCQIEKGESKANELQLTEDGFIKNWPQDFFGDDMGDLVAMTEASIERKRR
jgi:hypothetical protein